ncbi:MAG: hypothetical protein IJ466_04680 [Clostridia bacterium]|nr:hypothetical protein [Clostridia bacterium]
MWRKKTKVCFLYLFFTDTNQSLWNNI